MKFSRKQGGQFRLRSCFLFWPRTARTSEGLWETRWLTFAIWTETYTPGTGWEAETWEEAKA